MVTLHSKKELDREVLNQIVRYYRIDREDPNWDPEEFLEWECFSHPSLELHECNCRSRLPGGHLCRHCNHIVGKPCPISCDFQTFCLAVFAWRMGIGGSDFKRAVEHNLYVFRPEELYDAVIKKFSLEDTSSMEIEPEPDTVTEVDAAFVEKLPPVPTLNDVPSKRVSTSATVGKVDDLLSIKEAAGIYGCTYANIYNYIKGGRLPSISKSGKMFVSRPDLIAFKERPRRILKK